MGCSRCEQARRDREAAAAALRGQQTVVDSSGEITVTVSISTPCGYSVSQLTKWKQVLDCGYLKGLLPSINIDEPTYGHYIGIIEYTINNIDGECMYLEELNNILRSVHVLVALEC